MKKRKIVMSVLIVTMLASCMACGNIKDHKNETLKNSVTEKVTVSDTEIAEDTENIEPVTVATEEDTEKAIESGNTNVVTPETKESVAESNKAKANDNAVASKHTEKPAKKPADNTVNSNAGKHENNDNNSSNNDNHNDNTEKPHVHKYNSGVVTKEPTCTDTGVKTYTCVNNDDSYTETIPALGHDYVTRTETVTIKEAWDEDVWESRYICNGCGKQFKKPEDFMTHSVLARRENPNTKCKNYYSDSVKVTIHHPAETKTVYVVDKKAYDECKHCHKTRESK